MAMKDMEHLRIKIIRSSNIIRTVMGHAIVSVKTGEAEAMITVEVHRSVTSMATISHMAVEVPAELTNACQAPIQWTATIQLVSQFKFCLPERGIVTARSKHISVIILGVFFVANRCCFSLSGNRPKERPRLALQPRTLPPPAEATPTAEATGPNAPSSDGQLEEQPASAIRPRTSVSSAEVFGGARPVDTSAREREIEEKLKKQQEEFRRQAEERKQGQQQQRDQVRKSSSSNFVPE